MGTDGGYGGMWGGYGVSMGCCGVSRRSLWGLYGVAMGQPWGAPEGAGVGRFPPVVALRLHLVLQHSERLLCKQPCDRDVWGGVWGWDVWGGDVWGGEGAGGVGGHLGRGVGWGCVGQRVDVWGRGGRCVGQRVDVWGREDVWDRGGICGTICGAED